MWSTLLGEPAHPTGGRVWAPQKRAVSFALARSRISLRSGFWKRGPSISPVCVILPAPGIHPSRGGVGGKREEGRGLGGPPLGVILGHQCRLRGIRSAQGCLFGILPPPGFRCIKKRSPSTGSMDKSHSDPFTLVSSQGKENPPFGKKNLGPSYFTNEI